MAGRTGNLITHSRGEPSQAMEVERELARTRFRLRFRDPSLERVYNGECYRDARLHNRIAVSMTILLFDAFIIPELRVMPEVVGLSAVLRFALLTPATIAFVLLDWRGLFTRSMPALVTALLVSPALIAAVQAQHVTSASALSNYEAVPLLQLAVLTCRLNLLQAACVNAGCSTLFIWTVLTARFVPPEVAPSLIFTTLAIGIGTLMFAWRIDLRDRQVFLLGRQAASARDMLAAQNRTLARLTQVDALTGMGNRRCFDETMASLWDAAASRPARVSLILFDIDCFKQFNDALGHSAGDECLGAVARTAIRFLRDERDVLVRYGGEEFAIIMPDTTLEEGCKAAERVRLGVLGRALPHPGGGPHEMVTISLGVATVMAPAQTSSALVEAADRLLYVAKRQGRNQVAGGPNLTALRRVPEAAITRESSSS